MSCRIPPNVSKYILQVSIAARKNQIGEENHDHESIVATQQTSFDHLKNAYKDIDRACESFPNRKVRLQKMAGYASEAVTYLAIVIVLGLSIWQKIEENSNDAEECNPDDTSGSSDGTSYPIQIASSIIAMLGTFVSNKFTQWADAQVNQQVGMETTRSTMQVLIPEVDPGGTGSLGVDDTEKKPWYRRIGCINYLASCCCFKKAEPSINEVEEVV